MALALKSYNIMSFDCLHLDMFPHIFDYLTQVDLYNLLLMNHTFYKQINNYKLNKIDHDRPIENYITSNMIITMLTLIRKQGFTFLYCLYYAIEYKNFAFADILIKNMPHKISSTMMDSCSCGIELIVDYLIDKKIKFDLNIGLEWACRGKQKNIIQLMIKNGANHCSWCSWCKKSIEEHKQ